MLQPGGQTKYASWRDRTYNQRVRLAHGHGYVDCRLLAWESLAFGTLRRSIGVMAC